MNSSLNQNCLNFAKTKQYLKYLSSLFPVQKIAVIFQEYSKLRRKAVSLHGISELLAVMLNGVSDSSKEHEIVTSIIELLKNLP